MRSSFPEAEVTRSLSSNLVKYFFTSLSQDEEKRVIDSNELVRKRLAMILEDRPGAEGEGGFVSGLGAVDVLEASESGGNIIKARDEAKEILDQARAEAEEMLAQEGAATVLGVDLSEKMLAQARAEAERIRSDAAAQAQTEKEQVLAQARQQGYNEGLVKAQAHEGAMEQEYLERMRSLENEYQQQADVLEPQFVDTITGIYEHIFGVELSSYREILTYLISAVLHKIEGSRSFIIHVSREDYAYVSMQKKQMLAGAVSENTTVDVVEDLTLGKNECMIETENGIFDCGLGTQMSELRRRLMLLAWSKEAELE